MVEIVAVAAAADRYSAAGTATVAVAAAAERYSAAGGATVAVAVALRTRTTTLCYYYLSEGTVVEFENEIELKKKTPL